MDDENYESSIQSEYEFDSHSDDFEEHIHKHGDGENSKDNSLLVSELDYIDNEIDNIKIEITDCKDDYERIFLNAKLINLKESRNRTYSKSYGWDDYYDEPEDPEGWPFNEIKQLQGIIAYIANEYASSSPEILKFSKHFDIDDYRYDYKGNKVPDYLKDTDYDHEYNPDYEKAANDFLNIIALSDTRILVKELGLLLNCSFISFTYILSKLTLQQIEYIIDNIYDLGISDIRIRQVICNLIDSDIPDKKLDQLLRSTGVTANFWNISKNRKDYIIKHYIELGISKRQVSELKAANSGSSIITGASIAKKRSLKQQQV